VHIPTLPDIYLHFRVVKLQRVICFAGDLIVRNGTFGTLRLSRFDGSHQSLGNPIDMEPGDRVPLTKNCLLQVSKYHACSELISVSDLLQTDSLCSQNGRLKLSVSSRSVENFAEILLLSPLIIYNCLPKPLQIKFIKHS
jgi:hypothetical protein